MRPCRPKKSLGFFSRQAKRKGSMPSGGEPLGRVQYAKSSAFLSKSVITFPKTLYTLNLLLMTKKRKELPSSRDILQEILNTIKRERVFLLFTAEDHEQIHKAANQAREVGFSLIGLDFNIPGIKDILKFYKRRGEKPFGVFSITNKKSARIAINAGARFIFSTHLDRGIIRKCNKENVYNSTGAVTPTEVNGAFDLRANSVSIFPAMRVGDYSLFISLKNIFPQIKIIPTDEMSPQGAEKFIKSGAYAVAPIINIKKCISTEERIKEFLKVLRT